MVSANLVDTLSEAWRFGEPPLSGPDAEEGSGSGTADPELLPLTPLLGPAAKAERRPLGPPGGRALVGRELELKTLRDSFAEAIRVRETRSALIVGQPGLGKRTIVERFVDGLPPGATVPEPWIESSGCPLWLTS